MKFAKRMDFVVLAVVAAACLALWLGLRYAFGASPAQAQIYYGSELVMTVPLRAGEARKFQIPQTAHVEFFLDRDGSLRFLSSDCPDQICVNAGRLSRPGQSAACLPNRVIVKIEAQQGSNQGEPDLVAG